MGGLRSLLFASFIHHLPTPVIPTGIAYPWLTALLCLHHHQTSQYHYLFIAVFYSYSYLVNKSIELITLPIIFFRLEGHVTRRNFWIPLWNKGNNHAHSTATSVQSNKLAASTKLFWGKKYMRGKGQPYELSLQWKLNFGIHEDCFGKLLERKRSISLTSRLLQLSQMFALST